ncbi:MAG: rubredoxin, partial [Actinomycetales bacterium]
VGVPGKERYERVESRHSWNSNHITTNVLLYHLQRHSDHHAHPTRRYQALRDADDAPSLPTGYAGMILLGLVPFLWRQVMDPLVVAHYRDDVRLANIAPRYRARYLRRYPQTSMGGVASRLSAIPSPSNNSQVQAQVMMCPGCSYRYDETLGDLREGFPAGTAWSAIPERWCCPDCGVRDRNDFVPAFA